MPPARRADYRLIVRLLALLSSDTKSAARSKNVSMKDISGKLNSDPGIAAALSEALRYKLIVALADAHYRVTDLGAQFSQVSAVDLIALCICESFRDSPDTHLAFSKSRLPTTIRKSELLDDGLQALARYGFLTQTDNTWIFTRSPTTFASEFALCQQEKGQSKPKSPPAADIASLNSETESLRNPTNERCTKKSSPQRRNQIEGAIQTYSGSTSEPWLSLIREATKQVPAVRWALGIAGIISLLAILGPINIYVKILGPIVMLVFMTGLVVFAKLSAMKKDRIFHLPIITMLWTFVLLICFSALLLVSSFFFNWPLTIALSSVSNNPSTATSSPPTKTENPTRSTQSQSAPTDEITAAFRDVRRSLDENWSRHAAEDFAKGYLDAALRAWGDSDPCGENASSRTTALLLRGTVDGFRMRYPLEHAPPEVRLSLLTFEALALLSNAQFSEAVAILAPEVDGIASYAAGELRPGTVGHFHEVLGDAYFGLGQLTNAAQRYELAKCAPDRWPLVLAKLGHCQVRRALIAEAIDAYDRSVAYIDPPPSYAVDAVQWARYRARTQLQLGICRQWAGQASAGAADIALAFNTFKSLDTESCLYDLALAHYYCGLVAQNQDITAALEHFSETAAAMRQSGNGRLDDSARRELLLRALYSTAAWQSEWETGTDALQELVDEVERGLPATGRLTNAITINPTNTEITIQYARALADLGHGDDALSLIERTVDTLRERISSLGATEDVAARILAEQQLAWALVNQTYLMSNEPLQLQKASQLADEAVGLARKLLTTEVLPLTAPAVLLAALAKQTYLAHSRNAADETVALAEKTWQAFEGLSPDAQSDEQRVIACQARAAAVQVLYSMGAEEPTSEANRAADELVDALDATLKDIVTPARDAAGSPQLTRKSQPRTVRAARACVTEALARRAASLALRGDLQRGLNEAVRAVDLVPRTQLTSRELAARIEAVHALCIIEARRAQTGETSWEQAAKHAEEGKQLWQSASQAVRSSRPTLGMHFDIILEAAKKGG